MKILEDFIYSKFYIPVVLILIFVAPPIAYKFHSLELGTAVLGAGLFFMALKIIVAASLSKQNNRT